MNELQGCAYKGYLIYYGRTPPIYRIKTVGSGKMPIALKSMFTNIKQGKVAIDTYLETKPKARKKAEIKE